MTTLRDLSIIDDPQKIRAADPEEMLDRIRELGQQIRQAWDRTGQAQLPRDLAKVRDVTVLGMGGSAIGGDLAAALLANELTVPMQVHRDYGCPNYIGRESLVIASSYSGNTEETLSGFAEARKRGAKIIALTTGGKLAEDAKAANLPLVTFSYQARPRATLGWSLGLVLGALARIGLVRDLSSDISTALSELDRYARTPDLGKDLARRLFGRIVGVYGAGVMGVMARRWKGQWNENAKNWSFFDVMPELNHNAVVGFPHPDIAPQAIAIIFLRSSRDNPRVSTRYDVTAQLLERAGIPLEQLSFRGTNMLSEALQAVYLGDHASFYITLLNGEDPSPNTSIDYLKAQLAKT
ncbi:MAG: bifunctional phosphoglucose/phosphomannose isomerase [Chloroflexi bacterium 13_1_40CM_4_68_4]|nr:MAG: bifunctional phosphoglucose/phosphomannose isomerase [Chloroflexi bacterium 13_1_40CM_4_68_4]